MSLVEMACDEDLQEMKFTIGSCMNCYGKALDSGIEIGERIAVKMSRPVEDS